jgi:fluoride exporter
MFKNFLLVGVGGMAGSMLRYLFSVIIKHNSFPYSTFVVNIIGSFIIGLTMAVAAKQQNFTHYTLLLATGICGGFTTFSAFSWESVQMLQQQRYTTLAIYILLSIVLGIAATFLGYTILKQA